MLPDSKYVLTSITNLKCDHPMLLDIFNFYTTLICDDKEVVFVWIPGHGGIQGNIIVDLAARHALEKPIDRRLVITMILKC